MENGHPYAAFLDYLASLRVPQKFINQWRMVPDFPRVIQFTQRKRRVRKPKWRRVRATLYARQQALEA